MSRAFVKETDTDPDAWPERVVSPHRNLTTPKGLELIQSALAMADLGLSQARESADADHVNRFSRERHYWQQRLQSAEVITQTGPGEQVRFGHYVSLERNSSKANALSSTRQLQIVGEDEANPAQGLISWVSPVAHQLLGAGVGELIELADGRYEVTYIGGEPCR